VKEGLADLAEVEAREEGECVGLIVGADVLIVIGF